MRLGQQQRQPAVEIAVNRIVAVRQRDFGTGELGEAQTIARNAKLFVDLGNVVTLVTILERDVRFRVTAPLFQPDKYVPAFTFFLPFSARRNLSHALDFIASVTVER